MRRFGELKRSEGSAGLVITKWFKRLEIPDEENASIELLALRAE